LYKEMNNDSEEETLMIGVQKKLMLMRNKRSDKNRCTEEVYNDEDRSDDGVCEEEADVNEEQKKR